MKRWRERIERVFSAVPFAEANEHETAIRLAGVSPSGRRMPIDDVFTATFAETGCPEMTREFLGKAEAPSSVPASDFAAIVGLKGVRVWYGVAQVAA
jgi:hypothetical protein